MEPKGPTLKGGGCFEDKGDCSSRIIQTWIVPVANKEKVVFRSWVLSRGLKITEILGWQ